MTKPDAVHRLARLAAALIAALALGACTTIQGGPARSVLEGTDAPRSAGVQTNWTDWSF
ncbi:MAG TPA: hypothetical protein VH183_12425 [Burkholderiaceae bacterium]|nr:hypothetical protein [Burkholderiaceae bacterium]